jgi:homopolymeric O-antigen transport system permease protein
MTARRGELSTTTPRFSDESAPPPGFTRLSARGGGGLRLRELWAYRELLYFLVWRDIKVRYKQTVLGAAWVILQPFLTMVVFTLFFGNLAKVPSDGIPYPLFSFTGLVPWTLFAYSLTESSGSLVTNQNLITKVYFPRLIIPLASVLAGLVDFAISFAVLLLLMLYYGVVPNAFALTIPIFVVLAVLAALSIGIWLSALNVEFRDVRYTIPFLTQLWMFVTPLAYASSLVPQRWRLIYGLNPMAGVVEGFRWALLGKTDAPGLLLAASIPAVVLLLIGGAYYFRRMERTFADVV